LGRPNTFAKQSSKTSKPGVVTGLAYTPTGGEVLHIEATRYSGKGNITLTGQIGNVMKDLCKPHSVSFAAETVNWA